MWNITTIEDMYGMFDECALKKEYYPKKYSIKYN